ncbi:MAG: molecular chaperone HtpG [Rhodobacteraceae bacterium]|nr:molecular chaperone HtpG [Paracoccaceae bacterium]
MTISNHAFEADTGKILDIVINSLYSQKEIFLRELISNASDALNKRRVEGSVDGALLAETVGEIVLEAHEKKKILKISDNGIGLDEADMVEALGTIARSGTKAFLDNLQSNDDKDAGEANLIGQFGVGFYSAFMVADKVEVVSKKAGTDSAFKWESDGATGYSIEPAERDAAGTTITLHLKKADKEYASDVRLRHLVKKYSDHVAHPIKLVDDNGEMTTLNTVEALWTKAPKDISPEDYKSFYNSVGATYDDPFLTIHNKAEGAIEFTNLLFAPSTPPFDLFDPERNSKINLYINRVFITDDCNDLVPKWLRFLRGVVDTPSLDLNVSREMLQQSVSMGKIRKAIVKKVMSEIKKKIKKNSEAYDVFWGNFGKVIKEGLYEDNENREKIVEICRFQSSQKSALISLEAYIEAMPDGQSDIYYLTSDDMAKAAVSPHLEGFAAKNIDVLLLTDPIDEFWIGMMPDYKDKKFISISRGEIDIDSIKSDDAPKEDSADADDYVELIAMIKADLAELISDARISKTLTSSPSRLVAVENGMDIQMERMMKAQNPNFEGAPKILEINGGHDLIKAMQSAKPQEQTEILKDLSLLLFEQAQILDGKIPHDTQGFARRLTKVMHLSL